MEGFNNVISHLGNLYLRNMKPSLSSSNHLSMKCFSDIYNLPWKTCHDQSKSISTFSVSGLFDILQYADSAEFADRIDGLQDRFVDVLRRTTGNVAHPWVELFHNLGMDFRLQSKVNDILFLERKYFEGINNNRNNLLASSDRRTDYYQNYETDFEYSQDYHHSQPSSDTPASLLLENLNNYFPNFETFRF